MTTSVVNIRTKKGCDVYIGRGSIWGNRFVIGVDGSREEVINLYRCWIKSNPELLAQIETLRGKRLGCYCAPAACHGDVLVELLAERETAQA